MPLVMLHLNFVPIKLSTAYGKTINAKHNEEIELTFLAKNHDQIAKTELFVDFDRVYETEIFQPKYSLKLPETGLFTLNVEYISKSGFKCTLQINVKIGTD